MPVGEVSTKLNILLHGLYTDFSQASPFFMQITREQLNELQSLIEDTVEYYCDENIVSGEKIWTVLECLSTAKLAELRGELG